MLGYGCVEGCWVKGVLSRKLKHFVHATLEVKTHFHKDKLRVVTTLNIRLVEEKLTSPQLKLDIKNTETNLCCCRSQVYIELRIRARYLTLRMIFQREFEK